MKDKLPIAKLLLPMAMTAIVSSVLAVGLFKLMDRREPVVLLPSMPNEASRSIEIAPTLPAAVPDYARWELVKTLPWSDGDTRCVAFSPDGRTLAVGGGRCLEAVRSPDGYPGCAETGLVQLWDAKIWSAKLQIVEARDQSVAIAFYPEGTAMIIGDRRVTKIVDAKTGALKFSIPGGCSSLALNPQENILATNADVFWNSLTGEPKPCFAGYVGDWWTFSPDGRSFYANAHVFAVKTGREYGTMFKPGCWGKAVFSHDSKMIATNHDLWMVGGDKPVWKCVISGSTYPSGIAFTPGDKFVISSDYNSGVSIVDAATGEIVNTLLPGQPIMGMSLSPDGSYLATIGFGVNEPVKVWRVGLRERDGI
jgi:WD40 repeat protein